jgi:hypothetical protein
VLARIASPALRRAFVLVMLPALLGTGCGYHLVRPSEVLGDAKTIAIRGFANETFEAGVDSILSDAMTREFIKRGSLEVTKQAAPADLVMSGVVQALQVFPRSFSSINFALEYEVWITVAVQVHRRDGTPMRMASTSHVASERYLSSPDVEVIRTNRQEAIRRVSGTLASRVYDALLTPVVP